MEASFYSGVKLEKEWQRRFSSLFLQFFGTIYKGQLDCVNVILFTKLLQLMDTFCVLKTRIPF